MISCGPHYLQFSSVCFGAFYIPPQTDAGTKTALNELYSSISKQENAHPDAELLVLPNFYQHVKCTTRGKKTLDHLYSIHRDMYKSLPRNPFGQSDRNSILLIPVYKQKLKQEAPVTRSIKKWSDEADAKLQDCFASTDWNMFWDPPVTLRSTPHQSLASLISASMTSSPQWLYVHTPKPWITGNIHTELKGRAAPFNERDSNPEAYKKSCNAVR